MKMKDILYNNLKILTYKGEFMELNNSKEIIEQLVQMFKNESKEKF